MPAVIFFKNGDKIGELIGCIPPKHINTILQRHMPSKEESSPGKRPASETAESPMPSTSVTVEPGLCRVCHLERVVKSLPSHPNDGIKQSKHKVDLDKLAENAERCDYCQFLIQTCRRDPKFLDKVTAGGGRVILLAKRDKGLAWLGLEGTLDSGRKSDLFKSRVLQMVTGSKSWHTSTHFSGRMVGNQPDFDIYRSWIQLCNDLHSPNCQEETMEATELGLRLTDVEDCCVVNAPRGARYVALSYVWGKAKQLMLLETTFEELTSRGGLSHPRAKKPDIPKTALDAMAITSSLGFRYLWIDALCIQQDNEKDQKRQIDKMDRIYCCASLTIVSTGPSADSEIPGIRQASRTPDQAFCKVGDIQLLNSLPTLSQALSVSQWDRRGWTLQEKALSKRLLIFTEFQVYWHCNSAIYAEDTILEVPKDTRSLREVVGNYEEDSEELRRVYKPSSKSSATNQYVSLLRSYMTRDLTCQKDALKAFSGVLNVLAPRIGEHFWGLPTLDFDGSMLWSFDGHFPKRRREDFPSWSWAGWESGAHVDMNESRHMPAARIWWWKMNKNGEIALINTRTKYAADSEYTNEFFGVESSSAPPCPVSIPALHPENLPLEFPMSHILRFWTSTAAISVSREPSKARDNNYSEYSVYIPGQNGRIYTVILDDVWRKNQGDELDVIFLSRVGGDYKFKYDIRVWTMIIEWKDGIAYRVQQFIFPLRLIDWEAAKPQFLLITLA